ncbi:MAG TPA: hypothetical protein VHY37_04230, partial [Tepidisphaeraceae bacterium]|nr:hypothetical protein [Tepidisphaeraceae bacterium]
GLIVVQTIRGNMVTVQVDADTLSVAKGRGEPQWLTARWPDLRSAVTKSSTYKGTRTEWLEVEFPDGQKRTIRDPQARQAIATFYARFHPKNA